MHNMPFLNMSLMVAFWRKVVEEIQIFYSVIWRYVTYTFACTGSLFRSCAKISVWMGIISIFCGCEPYI